MKSLDRRLGRLEARTPRRVASALILRTLAETGEPLRASWPGGELWADGETLAAFMARVEAMQGAMP